MRERDKSFCYCGNLKLKTAKQCKLCYMNSRPSKKDICICGNTKMRNSLICEECARTQRTTDSTSFQSIRGPLPTSGKAAIYMLRDSSNKVFYVGSSTKPRNRINQHRQKYGSDITMIILKIVDKGDQWEEEVLAMIEYKRFIDIKTATPGPTTSQTKKKDKAAHLG